MERYRQIPETLKLSLNSDAVLCKIEKKAKGKENPL